MKLLFAIALCIACLSAQPNAKINYSTPQDSVQTVAQALSMQAGLQYDWQKSHDQTDPICRSWVRNLDWNGVTFDAAMLQVLNPLGLDYAVENGKVVLSRNSYARISDTLLNYASKKKPKMLQDTVSELAAQAGLGYNREKSLAQTDPECRLFLYDFSIRSQTFPQAMARLLDPVGLRYQIESGQIVLYRR